MGEGDKRRSKRGARFDSRELAILSEKQTPSETAWDARVAAGTQKVPITPLEARVVTVDDPLTTSLLAEVTRRSMTIDVSPDQIDEVTDAEPADPDPPGATAGDPTDRPT